MASEEVGDHVVEENKPTKCCSCCVGEYLFVNRVSFTSLETNSTNQAQLKVHLDEEADETVPHHAFSGFLQFVLYAQTVFAVPARENHRETYELKKHEG